MQNLTRDEQIRGYIRGVLVVYSGENLSPDNIGKLSNELVKAISDALELWKNKDCQHESDTPDHEDYLKCKKCGEFYR